MIRFACITSMNKKYYDFCGKDMLESYLKFASHIPLYLYNEDFDIDLPIHKQGWDLGKDYENFIERWNGKKKKRIVTFAKKAFSIIHAMENIKSDRLVWIDADCILTKKLDTDMLISVSNDNTLSTHFEVKHIENNKTYHSCETGFFILNKTHILFENFKIIYKGIYLNDDTRNLRRFYDGEVYGETVQRLDNLHMNNLNNGNWKTPIKRSVIGQYIDHFKGKNLKNNTFMK